MGTSTPITFDFLKFFKTSYFCIFKNYVVKYVDRFRHDECTQKSPIKKYFIFRKYKKDNFFESKLIK
jgi:hypothetical protein